MPQKVVQPEDHPLCVKDFDVWNSQKKRIDASTHIPPLFKEREVWWSSFGVNIGSEVCGKNNYFRRPVLIIKKLSQRSFIGIPLSSKKKESSWYMEISHKNGTCSTANLAQIRHFDYRRLDKKMMTIDVVDFERIKKSLAQLLLLI